MKDAQVETLTEPEAVTQCRRCSTGVREPPQSRAVTINGRIAETAADDFVHSLAALRTTAPSASHSSAGRGLAGHHCVEGRSASSRDRLAPVATFPMINSRSSHRIRFSGSLDSRQCLREAASIIGEVPIFGFRRRCWRRSATCSSINARSRAVLPASSPHRTPSVDREFQRSSVMTREDADYLACRSPGGRPTTPSSALQAAYNDVRSGRAHRRARSLLRFEGRRAGRYLRVDRGGLIGNRLAALFELLHTISVASVFSLAAILVTESASVPRHWSRTVHSRDARRAGRVSEHRRVPDTSTRHRARRCASFIGAGNHSCCGLRRHVEAPADTVDWLAVRASQRPRRSSNASIGHGRDGQKLRRHA